MNVSNLPDGVAVRLLTVQSLEIPNLDNIALALYTIMWQIELTDEFEAWWDHLSEAEQDSVRASVELLEQAGPNLGRPHVDHIKGSKHANMKELRTQHAGRPLRSFFAFDPRRTAILLIGGNKSGDDRFYEKMIPAADQLYDVYLSELEDEGLI